MGTWTRRLGVTLIAVVGTLAFASAAFAHVEVSAQPAVAGAAPATVTFSAEAESGTAGITSVRIVLPAGITPNQVSLAKAPAGWQLTATADGYTVGGTALRPGADAVHSVSVARLPEAATLVFKALVNYSDGSVDRWIEAPTAANPNPDQAAPVLNLRPGTPAPAVTTPPPATPPAANSITVAASSPAAAPATSDGGSAWLWLLIAAVAVGVVGAVVAVILARRRA
ncbi:MAG TPA: DUF1775 domain-containing protein [Micromonosporaceae bacterium]